MMMVAWYTSLLESVESKRHLFWHSSAVLATNDIENHLLQSKKESQSLHILDCMRMPLNSTNDVDVIGLENINADILVILNFDALLSLSRGSAWMRQLRPQVMKHVQQGCRLIVASRKPQFDFPAIDGSGLATDCVQYVGKPLRSDDLHPYMTADAAKKLIRCSAGLLGPASEVYLAWQNSTTLSGHDIVAILTKHISAALVQCGSETISFLETSLRISMTRKLPVAEVPERVAARLLGAGIGVVDAQSDCIEILPGVSDNVMATSVELADRNFLVAPEEWKKTAGALFSFERMARKVLAESVNDSNEVVSLLRHLEEKIKRNFSVESGTTAPNLETIVNPIRWIDLSELFDLLIEKTTDSRLGGLTGKQWTAAKSDLLPIRNKIQHMRLPSHGDVEIVERHLRNIHM